jgi:hypothetical protein
VKNILCLFILFVGFTYAAEVTPTPPAWPSNPRGKANKTQRHSPSILIGPMTIVLGQTSFKDTIENIGATRISRHGDAADSLSWVCYTSKNAAATIWLTSSELGGGEIIDGFIIQKQSRPPSGCTEIPIKLAGITTSFGISLDSDAKQVKSQLGAFLPSHNIAFFENFSKIDRFSVFDSIALKFNHHSVIEIYSNRSISD